MSRRRISFPGVPDEPGYYVYELWADDVCLYVGRVGNSGPGLMRTRLLQHRSAKSWFGEVTRIVVSAFGGHEEIAAEEPRRIYELKPVHNRTYAAMCSKGHRRPFWANNYDRGTCPECKAGPEAQAYFQAYNRRPEIVAKERAREVGRQSYYTTRNALPEVKERKKRWALRSSRQPGPGQVGLF